MFVGVRKRTHRVLAFLRILWAVRHNAWVAARSPYAGWIFIMANSPDDCAYMYQKLNETFVLLKKERAQNIKNLQQES